MLREITKKLLEIIQKIKRDLNWQLNSFFVNSETHITFHLFLIKILHTRSQKTNCQTILPYARYYTALGKLNTGHLIYVQAQPTNDKHC